MKRLIGITGYAGSGKSTVGAILKESFGFQRIAFADAIKRHVMDIYDLSWTQMSDRVLKEQEIPGLGLSPRQIMQRYGTEVARSIAPDTWIRVAFSTIRKFECERQPYVSYDEDGYVALNQSMKACDCDWAIVDVRFLNEVQAIRQRGGEIIRVIRPGVGCSHTHQSEMEQDQIVPDYVIHNNKTVADLLPALQGILLS